MTAAKQTAQDEVKDIDAAMADMDDLELNDGDGDSEELEELLADDDAMLEDDGEIVEEETETAEAGAEEVDEDSVSEDDLVDLELQIDKDAAYSKQKATNVETVNPTEFKGKAGKSKASGGASRAKSLDAVDKELFVLEGDASKMSADDLDSAKKATVAARPSQTKVAEKFDNLFLSMSAGKAPSKYVVTAMSHLKQNPTTDSAGLVAAFKASGVGEGTARSQSGQIMALFPALKIAARSGKTLTLNPDSNVATYLDRFVA